jgi:hypothetical protein
MTTAGLLSFGRSVSASQKNLQVNTYNLQRGNAFPFVNMFMASDRPFAYSNTSRDGYTYLDSTGYPTSIPDAGEHFQTVFAVYMPPPGESYTLSWTGAGTVTLGFLYPGFTGSASGTNPHTITLVPDSANYTAWSSATAYTTDFGLIANYVIGSDGKYYFCNLNNTNKDPVTDNGCYWSKITTGFQVNIRLQITATPVSDIKFYRTSLGAPSPTNMFDPQLLSVYGGYGIIRFIQWGQTIDSPISLWSNRSQSGTFSWWGNTLNSQWYVGKFPSPTKNALVAPQDPPGYVSGGWTDKMQVQAYWPSTANISSSNIAAMPTAITNANPCQITTATAHGLSTNDYVYFPEGLILSTPPTSVPTWGSGTTYAADELVSVTSGAGPQGVYISIAGGNFGVYPGSDITKWSYFTGSPTGAGCSINNLIAGSGGAQVTVIDSTNFTIARDSTTWPVYTSGGQVCPRLTLATPSLSAKKVIFAATSAMSPSYVNTQTNQLWIFTYDAEFDLILAQPYSSCQYGWPLEQQVALCNKLNCNGWFGIPHMADDDYVTQMATYIRDNLNSNLVAYYELSNEVWNGFWYETGYATTKAALYARNGLHGWTAGALPSYPISAGGYYSWFWYGWKFYEVMSNVKTVYAGKLNQCHCTLAHQAGAGTLNRFLNSNDPAIQGRHLASGCNTAAPPISVADSIATSSYTSPPGAKNGFVPTGLSAQMIWQYCYGGLQATALATFDTLWRDTFDVGSTENLYSYTQQNFPVWGHCANGNTGNGSQVVPWIQYEGGLQGNAGNFTITGNPYSGVTLTGFDIQNLFFGYFQSNYAQDLLNESGPTNDSSLQAFKANGGTHASLYAMTTQWGYTAMWGPIEPNEWGVNTGVASAPMLLAYKNYNETGNP